MNLKNQTLVCLWHKYTFTNSKKKLQNKNYNWGEKDNMMEKIKRKKKKKFHILQTRDRRDAISPGNKGEEHQTVLHIHPEKLSDEDMFTKQIRRGPKFNTEKIWVKVMEKELLMTWYD